MAVAARVIICPSVCPVPSCAPCPHAQTISRYGHILRCNRRTALIPLTRSRCATVPPMVRVAMHQPDPHGPPTIAHASQGHYTSIAGRIAAAHARLGARWLQVAAVAESRPALSSSLKRDHVLVLASHLYSISSDPPPHPTVLVGTKERHSDMRERAQSESTASFVDCCITFGQKSLGSNFLVASPRRAFEEVMLP